MEETDIFHPFSWLVVSIDKHTHVLVSFLSSNQQRNVYIFKYSYIFDSMCSLRVLLEFQAFNAFGKSMYYQSTPINFLKNLNSTYAIPNSIELEVCVSFGIWKYIIQISSLECIWYVNGTHLSLSDKYVRIW